MKEEFGRLTSNQELDLSLCERIEGEECESYLMEGKKGTLFTPQVKQGTHRQSARVKRKSSLLLFFAASIVTRVDTRRVEFKYFVYKPEWSKRAQETKYS